MTQSTISQPPTPTMSKLTTKDSIIANTRPFVQVRESPRNAPRVVGERVSFRSLPV
jgi:hypothetical protein